MLEANKSKWFEKIFAVYNRNLFKRQFHSVHVCGLDFLRQKKRAQIIYVNHSSWWDGLAAFEISQAVKADSFLMMEEKQLRRLFLFRKLGAFSVVRENPRQAVKSLNYAANLLREKRNRTLWIFPQGEILPNDLRPLRFYNGLARIVEKVGECAVVPCAIRYEFLGEFKPEIFVKIGAPDFFIKDEISDAKTLTTKFEIRLTAALDSLKTDIVKNNFAQFKKLL